MPNRNIVGDYRYGYQGEFAEKEPELGEGKNSFQLRLWDARIGRWLSPDPKGEFFSPYLGMGNNPINLIDPDGGKTCCKGSGTDGDPIVLDEVVITAKVDKPDSGGGWLSWVQTGLDILGSTEIPIVSQIADISSGVISLTQGDTTGALMSFGGAFIPGMSQAKLLRNGLKHGDEIVEGAYEVYKFVDKNNPELVKYVGITKQGINKRAKQHMNDPHKADWIFDTKVEKVTGGLNKTDAKILEQKLINKHGFEVAPKSSATLNGGGTLKNKINSISPKKWGGNGI